MKLVKHLLGNMYVYEINEVEYIFNHTSHDTLRIQQHDEWYKFEYLAEYRFDYLEELMYNEELLFQYSLVDEWVLYAIEFIKDNIDETDTSR